jgi:hypothetical protein
MKPLKTILLYLFSTIFSLFFFAIVLAGGCQDGLSCSGTSNCGCTRYRVDPGETITVFEHNLCQRVTNNSGYPQTFIPAKTQTEWNLFCTFRPNHISCSACANLISACPPGTPGVQNHLLGRPIPGPFPSESYWNCYGWYCNLPLCTPDWRYTNYAIDLSAGGGYAACIAIPGYNMPHVWVRIFGQSSKAYCINSYSGLWRAFCEYCVIGGESTSTLLPTCPFNDGEIGTVFATHPSCGWSRVRIRLFGSRSSGGCWNGEIGQNYRGYSIIAGGGKASCYVDYPGGGDNTYCEFCVRR